MPINNTTMDVHKAAATLRDQMIVLDMAEKQTEILDQQISVYSQQSLMSSLDGNTVKYLQLSLRLSVYEGVQQIYQQISHQKWNQVQSTARSIMCELQDTEMPSTQTSTPSTVSARTDSTAITWSRSYCDFYRDN